ncbi:pimeloyl-ACP methyl ester carboxylesterase [Actinomycetospora succinea]|uniref:Pimeloyl-ACP methyl ester carboxylesterase n=1 Tax=Actinomycetospora succinea TaxID=663603 RepID=A0A4R6V9M2_9PSEU|nr:alpha/beta hydrolase [Actinomycetospora succinea]TDQ58496.1 pimeloyl-ACP methyl ester carboxylesterase [Actinomycetospora succinea]
MIVRRPVPSTGVFRPVRPDDTRTSPEPPLADVTALGPTGDASAPTPYWPGREVAVGDTTLHVRETPGPAGETAVYVHGLGGSSNNWTELAGALSARCRGLAVDLPGFGRTPPPASGDYRPAAHAATLTAYLEDLRRRGSGPVHLLGNSLGGAVSLLAAAQRPDLVRTLTLVSPAMPDFRPLPSRLGGRRAALALLPLLGAGARAEQDARTPRERLARTMALCHADPRRVGDRAFAMAAEEAEERAGLAWAPEALHHSFLGLLGTWLTPRSGSPRSLWTAAARVTVPTLVVWGELDRLVGVYRAAQTAAALPAGRLLRLPDVGHVAQIERPQTVARAVLGLLDAAADGSWPAAEPAVRTITADRARAWTHRLPLGVVRPGAYGTVPV